MSLIEKNKKFFDFLSKYYDRGILHFWLNRILKKSLKGLRIKNNSVILDAGCGTGNFLKILLENKTLRLYGIDISKKILEIARKKLGRKSRLKLQEVENLKDKNKFDYIFSTEAFHHYSNQDKAMVNFHRALKKNGKLIIVDLNFGRILNWIFHIIEPGNSKMNSAEEFRKLFGKYNFKNIKQKKIGLFAVMTIGIK